MNSMFRIILATVLATTISSVSFAKDSPPELDNPPGPIMLTFTNMMQYDKDTGGHLVSGDTTVLADFPKSATSFEYSPEAVTKVYDEASTVK